MTQYEQLKEVLAWLADSYHFNAGTLELADLTEFFRVSDYGYNATEEDFEELQEKYDLEALAEFWDEGNGWTFSNLAGLLE